MTHHPDHLPDGSERLTATRPEPTPCTVCGAPSMIHSTDMFGRVLYFPQTVCSDRCAAEADRRRRMLQLEDTLRARLLSGGYREEELRAALAVRHRVELPAVLCAVDTSMAWSPGMRRGAHVFGPHGSGRTTLGLLWVRARLVEAVASGARWSLRYTTERQMLAELKPHGEGIERYTTPHVLILDDCGKSAGTRADVELLADVLGERARRRAVTLTFSTHSLRELWLGAPDGYPGHPAYTEDVAGRLVDLWGGLEQVELERTNHRLARLGGLS